MADFTALKTAIQNAIKQNGNEEITGNLLQEVLLAIVTTLGDGSINDLITALDSEATTRGNADATLQQNIDAEAQARQLADSTLQGGINTAMQAINAINNAITNGCVYAGIATPSSTPASGKIFYLALTAGTYTNYGGLEVPQGINILKNNGSTWLLDSFLSIDDAPTQGSSNLVKSGGVLDSIIKDGSAFDLSAYNNGTTYANLDAALTALNALPAAYKKGGMSMKFVQSSDNNYVQYFCKSNSFTIDINYWEKINLKNELTFFKQDAYGLSYQGNGTAVIGTNFYCEVDVIIENGKSFELTLNCGEAEFSRADLYINEELYTRRVIASGTRKITMIADRLITSILLFANGSDITHGGDIAISVISNGDIQKLNDLVEKQENWRTLQEKPNEKLIQLCDLSKHKECVHHDNFTRVITGDLWHIGSNGSVYLPMEYSSVYSDYETVDDGFRITNNKLVNVTNVTKAESIRLIDSQITDSFIIEISRPNSLKYEELVYNFVDLNKYSYLSFYGSQDYNLNVERHEIVNGTDRTRQTFQLNTFCNCISIMSNNGWLSIFIDEYQLFSTPNMVNSELGIGLRISTSHQYEYSFINVFNLTEIEVYSPINSVRAGVKDVFYNSIVGYSLRSISSNSPSEYRDGYYEIENGAEKFSVNYNQLGMDAEMYRSECAYDTYLDRNRRGNLAKYNIHVSLMVPETIDEDTLGEVNCQMHDTKNPDGLVLSPPISLGTKDNQWSLSIIGHPYRSASDISDASEVMYSDSIELGEIERGKWVTFDIFVKPGYMPEHNPITVVKRDGVEVGRSYSPNCYNNALGDYLRYGIYKYPWRHGSVDSVHREIYVKNLSLYR